jgi:D-sedoheptulose 7-phosphate isomerase
MHQYRELFRQVASNMTTVADSEYPHAVARAADMIHDAFSAGRKLLVFGNGGSSADAQHFAAEFVGRFAAERVALPAIALAANQAMLTAWSNDRSFEDIFAREIEALGTPGDVAFGISTSGRSPNVIAALMRARQRGLHTIGLTGGSGGPIAQHCDVLLAVPLTTTARIQEIHLVTYHAICAEIESRLAGQSSRAMPSTPSVSS